MTTERVEPAYPMPAQAVEHSIGQIEELSARFVGMVKGLAGHAHQLARRVKDAAQDFRTSPVMQHAAAARERGNMEAAFWLLSEEFTREPEDPDVALHYWDIALCLGRASLARRDATGLR